MTTDAIIIKLKQVVVEALGVPEEDINEASNFVEDLGADSLEMVNLVIRIEDEFDLVITDDEAEKLVTFGDAVKKLEELVSQNQQGQPR